MVHYVAERLDRTIVFGTASGSINTDAGKSKAVWTPSASTTTLRGTPARQRT